jgi:hypothetical protein
MTPPDDQPLRDALHAAVERDAATATAFAAIVAGPQRTRRIRWLRAGLVAGSLAAAGVAARVIRPRAPAAPVAIVLADRDPLLASATSSFLVRDTPDFTSSFALARQMANYLTEAP